MLEEIKSLLTEKHQEEFCDESKMITFFGMPELSKFGRKDSTEKFSPEPSSTNVMFLIETKLEGTERVVTKKYDSEQQD